MLFSFLVGVSTEVECDKYSVLVVKYSNFVTKSKGPDRVDQGLNGSASTIGQIV